MGNIFNDNIYSENEIINKKELKYIKSLNLIKTVKSKYITIEIFSYLNQNVKLEIIKYNKKYHNLLEINIESYKKVSKKIRIIENNGFGKEYTMDERILIFKGLYLNKKKHGKGIEYYLNGRIKFEGEYSNGYKIKGNGYNWFGELLYKLEKNGKIKEYYENDKLKFEGKFLYGRKNGKGKEYYENGKVRIEGEYRDDILNGKVIEYDLDGNIIFDGEYKNGNKWKGLTVEKDFQGKYLNGKRWNGKGKEYKNESIGQGILDYVYLLEFEGEYINGKRKGKGERYDFKEGKKYEILINEDNNNNDDDNADDDINPDTPDFSYNF